METIKIDYCGFWSSFNKEKNLFTIMLSKHFNVEISDNPDFVICSNRGKPFEYMKFDCPRIMFMGENLSPDFTVFDYVIGFDYLDFSDRYFRLPFSFFYNDAKPWIPEIMNIDRAKDIFQKKKYFCNFIYRHQSSHGMRERLFKELENYKEVFSPGKYLNNQNTNGCNWAEKAKYLKESSNLYNKDFTKIHERILNYEAHIIEHVKTNLFYVINTFMENIKDKIYINYYVSGLDEFMALYFGSAACSAPPQL